MDAQETMNRVIFDELCRGEVLQPSRGIFLEIVKSLAEAGAETVILGCTEIPLLVRPEDTSLPLFNTTVLHARKALEYAIAET